MEEANTPIADLKREQSDTPATSQNGLESTGFDAPTQSTSALDQGKINSH